MRGEPGNPGPPRTCIFTPAVPLPEASCQIPGTRSWQPGEFPSAKLAQPVTALPRGYDMTSLSNPYLTQVQRILHFTPRENHVPVRAAFRSSRMCLVSATQIFHMSHEVSLSPAASHSPAATPPTLGRSQRRRTPWPLWGVTLANELQAAGIAESLGDLGHADSMVASKVRSHSRSQCMCLGLMPGASAWPVGMTHAQSEAPSTSQAVRACRNGARGSWRRSR